MSQFNSLTHQGVVTLNARGFGFVATSEGEEYFIAPPVARRLVTGDTIRFRVEPGSRPDQFCAVSPALVQRTRRLLVGAVQLLEGRWMLVPDEPCFVPIVLESVSFIAPESVVAVRLADHRGSPPPTVSARLERVLGERTRKGFELDLALAVCDFPVAFEAQALSAAASLSASVDSEKALAEGLRDLRAVPLVTIDGESTRDFDDALCAEQLSEDALRVVVAIADVSHYVKPGSALDVCAATRATSVYLPGRTVPMLPEALSNGLCSLNPGEDRRAVVVDLVLDARTGAIQTRSFYRALIRSHARLTYPQASQLLQAPLAGIDERVTASVHTLHRLWQVLDARRHERGVLDFDEPEAKLVVREDGEYALVFEERTIAHRIVEESMLLANQAVAAHLHEKLGVGVFRHQPQPLAEDWAELLSWCAERDISLPVEPSLKAMAELIEASQERPDAEVIELRLRKVMRQAHYDVSQASHFSLGYASYAHFTSPIRRYADLLVHRLLLGEANPDALASQGAHCSERSRSARRAERLVWDKLKKRILVRDVPRGAPLEAKIVSSGRRGVRVVARQWQCSMLLAAETLLEEGYVFDSSTQQWVLNGRSVQPGESLVVAWSVLEDTPAGTELFARFAALAMSGE